MNPSAAAGLALMVVSEAGTLARIEPFWSWNTPIAWTGFILFADGIVWRARGHSWIRSNPGEFAVLSLLSIPLWLVFEFYNLFIDNWFYVGLPENAALRYFGYAWSFSTIWPAIFEGAELIAVWRSRGAPAARARREAAERERARAFSRGRRTWGPSAPEDAGPRAHGKMPRNIFIVVGGVLMLLSPFIVTRDIAQYLAAPVWLGFIFLLDPINRLLGQESLLNDWQAGRLDRVTNLALSGLLCGVLWEFWNYWSRAKWHYTVPIMENLKVFEMPLPGYLGFPAFALECFTMYVLVRALSGRPGRAIAL